MHPARYGFQQKPLFPIIATGHPLSKGLVGAYLFNQGGGGTVYDYSGRQSHCAINVATWGTLGLVFGGTQARAVADRAVLNPYEGSAVILFQHNGAWVDFSCLVNVDNATNNLADEFVFGDPGTFRVAPNYDESNFWDFGSSAENLFSVGDIVSAAAVWKRTERCEGYLDGILTGSFSGSLSWGTSSWGSDAELSLGGTNGAEPSANVTMIMALIYERALSVEEVRELYSHPYAIFYDPSQKRRYFDQSPAGAIELTAGVLTVPSVNTVGGVIGDAVATLTAGVLTVPSPGIVDATMLMPPKTIYIDDTDASTGSENPNGIIDLTPMMTALCSKLDANITKLHWIVSAPNDSDFSETPSLEATDTLDTPLTSNPQRSENYEYGD